MVDKNKLKMEGLKFGRLLQSVYRLSAMFTVEHRAADGAVKQSYEALNLLVKVVNQFTFGFLDHRVLLNNILTPDKSLRILENEFSKRGLGAVTFPAGLTMGGYRRLLSIICAYPEEIQRNGGIKRYFEQNQVEGVRVIPGQKGTSSMEEEERASGRAPGEAAWALGSPEAALVAVAVTALVSVLAQVAVPAQEFRPPPRRLRAKEPAEDLVE